jgi:hypothetical protein
VPHVGHRLGALQRLGRQVDTESAFGAQQQFHARQAVEAQVLVQHAARQHWRQVGGARVQVAQRGFHDRQQRRCPRFGCGWRRFDGGWGRHGNVGKDPRHAGGRTHVVCIMPACGPDGDRSRRMA